ncbi:lipoprotein B transmembrane [Parasulfuritortus cantonensis]|uniref:LPS-assembly lipoprotein LptE n=1 Tax=Parasulfuritortus cantonensis TaxID=2528202 RepID=A0A4R1B5H7_9PROT|nr:LPS assembly lipoprotein LptE [Parasulfuritortus cantonensis]TCJ12760.1 lipoprotein B transmembrane [Parasulfuritortus cantonensis]
MLRREALKWLAVGVPAALAGCGFQLRGQAKLPFKSAYVEAGGVGGRGSAITGPMPSARSRESTLAKSLRHYLDVQGKLAAQRNKADVVILLTNETRGKSILSLSGAGKVREYRLVHSLTISAISPGGEEMLAPTDIRLTRDFSYSDEQILAKEAEEATLRKDMEDEALRQIIRRLAFVRTE